MPPTMVVHTDDDRRFIAGSRAYIATLKAAGQTVQSLMYATGGHRFGLVASGGVKQWPEDVLPWLALSRFVRQQKAITRLTDFGR